MVKERSAKEKIRQSRIFPFGCPFWALPLLFFLFTTLFLLFNKKSKFQAFIIIKVKK
jgi:hypothetical protein